MEIRGDNNIQEERPGLMTRFKLFLKQEYFKSKINLWLLILGIVANVINWAILAIFIRPTDNQIILHYNVYFGVDAMGSWKSVYVLPAIGLVLYLIDVFLSYYFYQNKERIAGYVLLIAGFMAQLSLVIASVSVIIINY